LVSLRANIQPTGMFSQAISLLELSVFSPVKFLSVTSHSRNVLSDHMFSHAILTWGKVTSVSLIHFYCTRLLVEIRVSRFVVIEVLDMISLCHLG